jgi:cation diffusion facilitator CzcD-associated flavoprotein CzcO
MPSPADEAPRHIDVLIVGGGFSGLGMAIQLRKAKRHSFLVIEKGDDIGGTWWENKYPGCACDIPSHLYSFSWDPNASWSRMYATQPEILEYLKWCAERHDLLPYILLKVRLTEAAWDEAQLHWKVTIFNSANSTFINLTARVIVSGMGALHIPRLPDLPGLDRFKGPAFHSSAWDPTVSLAGKRIAVIGTGASAIQFVPQIAPDAGKLTLFQRTPAWVLPRLDFKFSDRARRRFLYRPSAMWFFRIYIFWTLEIRAGTFLGSKAIAKKAQEIALRHLRRQVKDPQLREALTPNYAIGCKRILISSDFYPALARPNVELVTAPITEGREHSVITADGTEHPVDVLIYGTGFKITELARNVRILGRGDVSLEDVWKDRMSAYLGISVNRFPNLFFLLGPNTGLGHNSVVLMIEAQVRYIMKCLRVMRRHGKRAMDVNPDAFRRFFTDMASRLKTTVWETGGCRSWYQDPQTGENIAIWPGTVVSYLRATRRVITRDYDWS